MIYLSIFCLSPLLLINNFWFCCSRSWMVLSISSYILFLASVVSRSVSSWRVRYWNKHLKIRIQNQIQNTQIWVTMTQIYVHCIGFYISNFNKNHDNFVISKLFPICWPVGHSFIGLSVLLTGPWDKQTWWASNANNLQALYIRPYTCILISRICQCICSF